MSLLRLLTAGRCLVGSGNPETRYHLSRSGALPKFGAKKNPFRATTRPEAAQAAAIVPSSLVSSTGEMREDVTAISEAITPPEEKVSGYAAEKSAAVEPVHAEMAGATNGAVAAGDDARPPCEGARNAGPAGSGAFARYTGKLKSLLKLQRSGAAEPTMPRAAKHLVQPELSLERVRVVRNDLSDSDVEIVPVKPVAAPVPEPQTEKPLEKTWEKVTGRLFGAGKV